MNMEQVSFARIFHTAGNVSAVSWAICHWMNSFDKFWELVPQNDDLKKRGIQCEMWNAELSCGGQAAAHEVLAMSGGCWPRRLNWQAGSLHVDLWGGQKAAVEVAGPSQKEGVSQEGNLPWKLKEKAGDLSWDCWDGWGWVPPPPYMLVALYSLGTFHIIALITNVRNSAGNGPGKQTEEKMVF